MSTQHTPGPWRCSLPFNDNEKDDRGNSYWEIASEEFHQDKLYLAMSAWMSEANARLIAAAPDMLEALEGVYARCCGEYPDHPETLAVAAAIAKAKGTNQNV